MISTDQLEQVQDATVYDSDGEKVGKAGSVYLDDRTGEPSWVTVKTGLFGNNGSFAPLQGANFNGERMDVESTKPQIQDAPNLPAGGHLEPDQERDLYCHFAKVLADERDGDDDSRASRDNRDSDDSRDGDGAQR